MVSVRSCIATVRVLEPEQTHGCILLPNSLLRLLRREGKRRKLGQFRKRLVATLNDCTHLRARKGTTLVLPAAVVPLSPLEHQPGSSTRSTAPSSLRKPFRLPGRLSEESKKSLWRVERIRAPTLLHCS